MEAAIRGRGLVIIRLRVYYRPMTFYDVTVALSNELPTYPGDPGIQIGDWRSLAKGDSANVSVVNFGAHTGTHVDAPAHFIEGAAKIESLPLEALIGEAVVVEVPPEVVEIGQDFVSEHVPSGTQRVLFKTRNSVFWNEPQPQFHSDFTHLSTDAVTAGCSRKCRSALRRRTGSPGHR